MSKKLKILLILLISFVLVSFSTSTYAVNMDLTDDEGSTSNEETSNTANTGNTASSENTSNTSTNEASNSSNNTTNSIDSENTNTTSNTSSTGNKTTPPVTQTVAGSQSSGELQISDILNILLIVIGVLLILLGIAILIRLKK